MIEQLKNLLTAAIDSTSTEIVKSALDAKSNETIFAAGVLRGYAEVLNSIKELEAQEAGNGEGGEESTSVSEEIQSDS